MSTVPLVRLLLGRGDPGVQGRPGPRPSGPSGRRSTLSSSGTDRADRGRDPQVEGLLRRAAGGRPSRGSVSFSRASSQPWIVASRPGYAWSGCGEVDRVQRPGLRAGRDGGERRGVHQQQAGAARVRGRGARPSAMTGTSQVDDRCAERHAVLIDRARTCRSAAPRWRRRPRPTSAGRPGSRAGAGRSHPRP